MIEHAAGQGGPVSEHKIPELTKPLSQSKHWDAGIDSPLAGERAARLEREDQLRDAFERIVRVEAERDELERKGKALCSAHGNALITIHDLEKERDALRGGKFSDRDYAAIKSRAERAEAALGRMQGPVTDEELQQFGLLSYWDEISEVASRVNALLAARAGMEKA